MMSGKGRSLPSRPQVIPDGGPTRVIFSLPSNTRLLNVSARPEPVSVPQTLVKLYVAPLSDLDQAAFLNQGYAWSNAESVAGERQFAHSWNGELTISEDFEYSLIAVIYNYSGAAVKWILSAYVGDL